MFMFTKGCFLLIYEGFETVQGIEGFSEGLVDLNLADNSLTNVQPLAALTKLSKLILENNLMYV
jgi:Leucine-rich repeat (LRR) protein